MRRLILILAVITLSANVYAATRFLSPQENSQLAGRTLLSVETDRVEIDRVEFRVDGALVGAVRRSPWQLVYDFGDGLLPHRITATVHAGGYRTTETAEVRSASLSASGSLDIDFVEVPVTIRSSRKVTAGDLIVRESGVRQTIRELRSRRSPSRITFIIDRSASMRDGSLEAALDGARRQLVALEPEDDPRLLLFNHRVDDDIALRRAGDVRVEASGGTALRDAVAATAAHGGILIVVSDGADRNSILDAASALSRVQRSNVIVHALVLGSGEGAEFLRRSAASTGGSFIRSSAKTLQRDLGALVSDMNARKTVVYQSVNSSPGWRSIEISASRPGVVISGARKGYTAE